MIFKKEVARRHSRAVQRERFDAALTEHVPPSQQFSVRNPISPVMASKFAESLAGKPQTSQDMLKAAMSLIQIMTGRED